MNALEAVTAAVAARPDDLCVSSLGTATSALRCATGDAPHLYLGGSMGSGLRQRLAWPSAARTSRSWQSSATASC